MALTDYEKNFLKELIENHLAQLEVRLMEGSITPEFAINELLFVVAICGKLDIKIPEKVPDIINLAVKKLRGD